MKPHATATRRQFLKYAGGAAAATALGTAAFRREVSGVGARPVSVSGGAGAVQPAVRMSLVPPDPGELVLPVGTGDGLIVLDNFGGRSVSLGNCSHRGIDVFPTTAAQRTLLACVDGTLRSQRIFAGAQGNAWILEDDQGICYRYHHIDEFLDGLEVGSRVQRGQPIATMGSSGNAGSPHLHFEVRFDGPSGTAVDPFPMLTLPVAGVEVRRPQDAVECSLDATDDEPLDGGDDPDPSADAPVDETAEPGETGETDELDDDLPPTSLAP